MEGCTLKLCDICNKNLTDPRILPCSHSFCLKCLEVSDMSPKCPTCHIEFQIPDGGLKDLKKNEYLEKLNILKQNNINCESCNENQAIKFCVDCSFNYCSICLDHHGRIPTSKNHHLQPIRSAQDALEFNISTCVTRSELINLICKDCKVLLCNQCSILSHNNHETSCMSQCFESVKIEIEEKWKMKEEIVKQITSNFNDARDTISDIELKASNLKKEIQKRGANVKIVVDSIVAKLIATVDKELMEHKNGADVVMKELKNMEAILNEQIESLKQQIDNLEYENVVEMSSSLPEKKEKIPKYSELFNVSLVSEINELKAQLEKIFGTLRKAPRFSLVDEVKVCNSYTSFASSQDDIYFGSETDSKIDVFNSVGMDLKSSYDLKNVISKVSDLLAFNEMLFVIGFEGNYNNNTNPRNSLSYNISGISANDNSIVKVIKIDSLSQPLVIYKFSNQNVCKLTKSFCQKDLLIILSNKLILLSQSGNVRNSIDLNFSIKNALQLDDQSYVVCSQNYDVCIINNCGNNCWKYSPSNDCHKFTSPCLAVDNYGNIYVGGRNILVVDRGLHFSSFHVLCDVNEELCQMCYDEVNDMLLVLVQVSNNKKLLTLKI